jgi:hypothetical protein
MNFLFSLLLLPLSILAQFGGTTTRDGDCVWVRWTNVPPCSVIEWSSDLFSWQDYSRYDCYVCTNPVPQISFSIKATNTMEFWRLRGCSIP